jgi:hypothetical protein
MIKLTIPKIVVALYRLRNIGASWCFQFRRDYIRIEILKCVFSIQVIK